MKKNIYLNKFKKTTETHYYCNVQLIFEVVRFVVF